LIASGGITERSIEQTSFRAYPNPLSESTTIDFMAETAGYASVSIVNALGTEVARLFSGELAAGEHSFTWNAEKNSIPNGMYECLVRMNGRVQQAGLVLMR
jgi:flagellar hook assembly protein FlgD